MNPYLIDIPVVLIFFNRPDHFRQVFEQVKKARPSKLYLSCDGPRIGNQNDADKIAECKKIAEEIDWECEVFKNYSETNLGCGRGPKSGIDFMFEKEEYGIILEDDCIPSISFFAFCKEMLEKYKDDERIYMVTGINFVQNSTACPHSYFFGYSGTNWGWATWKREWEKIDYQMNVVGNSYIVSLLKTHTKTISPKCLYEVKKMIRTHRRIKQGENISYWDLQWQVQKYLQHQLAIIPVENLITNIGAGADSTHAQTVSVKNQTQMKKNPFFMNERYELEFPLKHPGYVIPDLEHDRSLDKLLYPNFFGRVYSKIKFEWIKLFRK